MSTELTQAVDELVDELAATKTLNRAMNAENRRLHASIRIANSQLDRLRVKLKDLAAEKEKVEAALQAEKAANGWMKPAKRRRQMNAVTAEGVAA